MRLYPVIEFSKTERTLYLSLLVHVVHVAKKAILNFCSFDGTGSFEAQVVTEK
jgi:hypothetical protein